MPVKSRPELVRGIEHPQWEFSFASENGNTYALFKGVDDFSPLSIRVQHLETDSLYRTELVPEASDRVIRAFESESEDIIQEKTEELMETPLKFVSRSSVDVPGLED